MFSLELCRCSSGIFLPSRTFTGLATMYSFTGYSWHPIGKCEDHLRKHTHDDRIRFLYVLSKCILGHIVLQVV